MKTFVVRPSALASALAAASLLTLALPASPQTLPSGLQVISGQAQVATQGSAMTVTNTSGAILNWNTFNIGAGASVRFDQPGSSSQVLNRVVGNDPSTILGRLSSNGRVWLLNPNGVLFGENARVDVAGLVASTLRLNDDDWRAGRFPFSADAARRGEVTNRGELRSAFGGQVALIGSSVRNDGLIEAPGGQVVLAAGAQVELVDTGVPNLAVRVRSPEGTATNLGQIIAPGGRIDVHAAAVNQNGIVRADSLAQGPGGEIVIRASGGLDMGPSATVSADGASAGGQVTLDAGEGRLNLQGSVSTQASRGVGGDVRLLGREVALLDGARVDASGSAGGGEVLAGGGLQGRDARFANANALYMGPGATVHADALAGGNGGRIVLWSDNATRAFGSLSARGGGSGGDGGFIETSGGWLDARPGKVDLAAPSGATGRWLLDPYDLLITNSAPTANVDAAFTATGSPASINASVIATALSAGTNVTVSTGGAGTGSEAGTIQLGTGVTGLTLSVSGGSPGSLTFIADNSIVGSTVSIASSAPMPVTMLAGRGGSGGISLSSSSINTAGGNITLGGYATAALPVGEPKPGSPIVGAARGNSITPDGVHLSSVTLNAGNGDIAIRGIGSSSLPSNGVTLDSGTLISARNVLLQGVGFDGIGVEVVSASVTATNSLSLQGSGGSSYGVGVYAPSSLAVLPVGTSPTSLLEIWGLNPSGNIALMLDAGSSSSALLRTTGGAAMTLRANNCGCDDPALRIIGSFSAAAIDASAGGPVTIGVYGDGQHVAVNGVSIDAGSGGISLDGHLGLSLNNTQVSSAGPVRLYADDVGLTGSTSVFSSASGDAIIVAGSATSPLSSFFNSTTGSALFASSGRWIVFADTPLSEGWVPGGLVRDFTRYGSRYGGWSGDAGDGVVFADAQVASVTGSVSGKVYDGTTAASYGPLSASGLFGDSGSLRPGVQLVFVDRNAGVAKPLSLTSGNAFSMVDSLGKPVYGYTFSTSGLNADITRRGASVGGLSVLPKVYDGTTVATLGGSPTFSGLLPGDVVTLAGTVGAVFSDKNVGVGKTVNLSGATFGGPDGGNYDFKAGSLTGTITARPVSITGLAAADKVYDGTAVASIIGTPTIAGLPGDVVFVTGALTGTFGDKNAGSSKPVTLTGLSLGGTDAPNYTLSGAGALSASILQRPLVVSGLVALDRLYDATTVARLTGTGSVSPLSGDAVSVGGSPSGNFADKNVGSGKAITLTGAVLTGADAGNYRPVASSALTASITPRPISATGLSADDKVYDGTTTATFSGRATVAPLPGDVLLVVGTPSGAFADKNVGNDKPVNAGGLSLAGADAANYVLQPLTGLVADITAAFVRVTGLTATSKIYDATTVATLTGVPTIDAAAGPGLALTGSAVGRFADKNAGVGKPVTVSGLTLSGPEAPNYQLQFGELRADISPLLLSVAGVRASNKVYDGTTAATLAGVAGITGLPGDAVSISGAVSGRFADKNVGTGKAVTVSGLDLVGADAGNYGLAPLVGLTADITPLSLTVGGLSARDKVYDATTTAQLSGTATISAVAGDAVALTGAATASFADKNAGTAKPITVSGLSITGGDAGNYRLLPVNGLSATISPLTLPVVGLSATAKVYDGSTTAPLSGTAAISPLAGDAVNLAGSASGSFADRNVGSGKQISLAGLALAGADAANYRLSLPALRGDITPATLQYVAAPVERLFGQPIGALVGTVSGFVGGDTLAGATTGALAFGTPAVTGSPVGIYPITGSGLTAVNYRLVQAGGNATALSIVRLPPQVATDSGANLGVDAAVQTLPPPVIPVPPTAGGVVDLSVPIAPGGGFFGGAPGSSGLPGLGSGLPGGSPTNSDPTGVSGSVAVTGSGASGAAGSGGAAGAANGSGSSSGSSALRVLGGTALFDPLVVASRSINEMQDVLVARDRYKQEIFAEAIAKLEQNPALADLRPCASLQEAQAGTCLVTEELKQQYTAQVRVAAAAPAPAPAAPAPSVAPAPAAPPVAPATPSPAPAPAQPPAPAAQAPSGPAPALPEVIERKRVVTAALPQIERKVALLVGVDEYRDTTIPTLANAVKDARTVGRLFAGDLGYETYVVPNASRNSVVAALNRLALELKPHDSVVIYYAGHGQVVESTKLGYWQLGDADAKDPSTWLSNTDITRLVGRIGASQVAVISDSCYSGSLVAEQKLRAATGPVDPVAVLTRKSVVVMSSGGNEPVFDDGKQGHSPFAWNLMNTLRQVQTWQPGGQVFERVRFAVARELPQRPQYGASTAAGHQPGGDYLFESRQIEAAR